MDASHKITAAKAALSSWRELEGAQITPMGNGLVNWTFLATVGKARWILQCLNPIFNPSINLNIEAVTGLLQKKRILTPTIIPNREGRLFTAIGNQNWRLMSYVEGHTIDRSSDLDLLFSAGEQVAKFHEALVGMDYRYQGIRPGVHDLCSKLENLVRTLKLYEGHQFHDQVKKMASQVVLAEEGIGGFEGLPLRNCHGDLKLSNILLNREQRACALIDLDTVGSMIWPFEMGDALRSWCNPAGEDVDKTEFSAELFLASLSGYAKAIPKFLKTDEKAKLLEGIKYICLELAARFLTDALEEKYFAWDPSRFNSRSQHNCIRAAGQLALFKSITRQGRVLESIQKDILGG